MLFDIFSTYLIKFNSLSFPAKVIYVAFSDDMANKLPLSQKIKRVQNPGFRLALYALDD